MTIAFRVNGVDRSVECSPDATLLDVLREDLGITSPKNGCSPQAQCGCCAVFVDGAPRLSCAMAMSRVAGKTVTTLEGVPAREREILSRAFVSHGALQCGFCIPGIVVRSKAILDKNPKAARGEIEKALDIHLCRCTGYKKIVEAIRTAGEVWPNGTLPPPDVECRVGKRFAKVEGAEYALGDRSYIDDMRVDGMLYGAVVLSAHPRAKVVRIDVSAARAMEGVADVATWREVPGERYQGLLYKDWPLFVAEGEETRYVGDVLAAVAARTYAIALKAADAVRVEYEVLPPVTDPEAALKPDAPRIHPKGNLLSKSVVRRGDVDAALARSVHVATGTFQTQRIEHAFLEPESSLAVPDGEGIVVYSQGQGIYDDRRQIASFLGLQEERVRAVLVSAGGAFGGKEDMSIQAQTALLARRTGRPVKLTLTREESLRLHPKRHPIRMTYTVGCDAQGKLTGARIRMIGDKGAYASVGSKVLERAAGHATGAYDIQNVDVEVVGAYTNNPPCGAMRGFGAPQSHFAMESILDMLAEKVGIDGWEIRWRNALDVGSVWCSGQVLKKSVGLKKTLLAVRDAYRGAKIAGIACGIKNSGIGNGAIEFGKTKIVVEPGERICVYDGFTEMGQGLYTILVQIVCEETGLRPEQVRVTTDTSQPCACGQTTGSRGTLLSGNSCRRAAVALAEDLKKGRMLGDLAGREYYGEFKVDYTSPLGAPVKEPITHTTFGFATQVVILDDQGRLQKVVAAHDVGRALNPTLVEGQIEGSIHMGLGYALSEEFACEGGVPKTLRIGKLGILRAHHMPEIEVILVEDPEPEGPYGAKGVGEIGLVPTAGAVANALAKFDGIRRFTLPMKDSPAAKAILRRG